MRICFVILLLISFSVPAYSEIIKLRNGRVINAEIIKKTDDFIEIDISGILITHYLDEIESIDGKLLTGFLRNDAVPLELELKRLFKETRELASSNVFYEQLVDITFNAVQLFAPSIRKGVKHASEGNFQEARNQFISSRFKYSAQQFLDIISQLDEGVIIRDYAVHYFRSINHAFNLEIKEEVDELITAIEIDPESSLAYSSLGHAYGSFGYPEKGIGYLNKAIELDPNFIEAYLYLGKIYGTKMDQVQLAVTYFEKAIELDPDSVGPYSSFSAFYFSLKQPEQALVYSLKALEIDPNYVGTHLELSQIYLFLQKPEKALTYALKCFQIMPENPAPTILLSYLYGFLGKSQEAIPYIEKTLELNPSFTHASLLWGSLGMIYDSLEQREKAMQCYLKAWELNPRDFVAVTVLATYYFSIKQYEKVIFFAKKILELASEEFTIPKISLPNFPYTSDTMSYNPATTRSLIGASYVAIGQYKQAIPYLEEALRGKVDRRTVYVILAYAYQQLGNDEKVYEIESYIRALP